MDSNIDDFPEDILEQDIIATPERHDSSSNVSGDEDDGKDFQHEKAIDTDITHEESGGSHSLPIIVSHDEVVETDRQPNTTEYTVESTSQVANVSSKPDPLVVFTDESSGDEEGLETIRKDIIVTPERHDSSSNVSGDEDDGRYCQQENAIDTDITHAESGDSQAAPMNVSHDKMVEPDRYLTTIEHTVESTSQVANVSSKPDPLVVFTDESSGDEEGLETIRKDIMATPERHDSSSNVSGDEDDGKDFQHEKAIDTDITHAESGGLQSAPIDVSYDEIVASQIPNVSSKPDPLVVFTDESSDDEEVLETVRKSETSNVYANEFDTDGEQDSDNNNTKEPAIKSIFGDDDDDSTGHKSDAEKLPVEQDDLTVSRKENQKAELDDGREWDFDIMMRQKKSARRTHKRRRDGGVDIINDDDYEISTLVEQMKVATREDRQSNQQRHPALRKRMMLPRVKLMLLRIESMETLIDNGMMSAVSDWLSPLPDKSLPALEIRTELLKLLQSYSRLEQGCLKQSGLGKAVMMLYKHPRETKENKDLAGKLIREWSRPIFQLDDDFRSLSREERVERDLKNMPAAKKQRLSGESRARSTADKFGGIAAKNSTGHASKNVGRASIPRPSSTDYVHRPKSNVDGQFKGERKNSAFSQLDKIQRDFTERARQNKARRAVRVSVEGKNMGI